MVWLRVLLNRLANTFLKNCHLSVGGGGSFFVFLNRDAQKKKWFESRLRGQEL